MIEGVAEVNISLLAHLLLCHADFYVLVAADFAGCTLLHLDGAEVHCLGIEGEQSVGEQFAYTEDVLQCLGSLNGSEHTGDGSGG